MNIKQCEQLTKVAEQTVAEAIQAYDDLCAELSEAIELAYHEGFDDARSNAGNEAEGCWEVSRAQRAQI